MSWKKPLPYSYYQTRKLAKLGISETEESVEEYLARGGQINTIKADNRKYLSAEDREEYGNDEKMRHNVDFDTRSKLYDTQEWKSLRYKFIQSKKTEELVCQQCGEGPFTKENWKDMNVDHIKPVKHFWEERLNIDNLQILCWMCNRIKSNHYSEPFKLGDGAKDVLTKKQKKHKKR